MVAAEGLVCPKLTNVPSMSKKKARFILLCWEGDGGFCKLLGCGVSAVYIRLWDADRLGCGKDTINLRSTQSSIVKPWRGGGEEAESQP